MKYLFAALLVLVMVTGARGEVKTCEQCPLDKPCGYSQPSQDGCNMCSGETVCKNGKWYTYGVTNCTAMACMGGIEIPNPFEPTKPPEDRFKALEKRVKELEEKTFKCEAPECHMVIMPTGR
jgi:hypothetical protein